MLPNGITSCTCKEHNILHLLLPCCFCDHKAIRKPFWEHRALLFQFLLRGHIILSKINAKTPTCKIRVATFTTIGMLLLFQLPIKIIVLKNTFEELHEFVQLIYNLLDTWITSDLPSASSWCCTVLLYSSYSCIIYYISFLYILFLVGESLTSQFKIYTATRALFAPCPALEDCSVPTTWMTSRTSSFATI